MALVIIHRKTDDRYLVSAKIKDEDTMNVVWVKQLPQGGGEAMAVFWTVEAAEEVRVVLVKGYGCNDDDLELVLR